MVEQENLIQHASKGFIKAINNSTPALDSKDVYDIFPDFNRENALKDIREDDTVKSSIITLTDKSLEYGYKISSVDGKSNLTSFEDFKQKARFDKILRKTFSNLYAYQNVFIENVKNGNGKAKELHILETTQTEPQVTINGEVKSYIQKVTGYEYQDYPTWDVEEVTHISIDDISETIWSDVAIGAIHKYVLLKNYIYAHYGWFFGTNQKRKILNFKDANEDVAKEFLSYLKKLEKDITKHLPYAGELESISLGDINDADKALAIVDKCDSNILKLLQVPSIAANETGNSNRSSGDKQDEFLATRIKAVHKAVKEAFENDLFVKIGFPKIRIDFAPPIKTNIDKLLQNAERMKNLGVKFEKIEEYLKYEGFPIEDLFDMEQIELMKQESQSKSMDMYPSRQAKSKDETSKNIGTGEQSTTRDEQLAHGWSFSIKNKSDKFRKYPYVI